MRETEDPTTGCLEEIQPITFAEPTRCLGRLMSVAVLWGVEGLEFPETFSAPPPGIFCLDGTKFYCCSHIGTPLSALLLTPHLLP